MREFVLCIREDGRKFFDLVFMLDFNIKIDNYNFE